MLDNGRLFLTVFQLIVPHFVPQAGVFVNADVAQPEQPMFGTYARRGEEVLHERRAQLLPGVHDFH